MREVPEWIGANDDQAIPARVKVRVFDKFRGCCNECGNPIRGSLLPAYDHVVALVLGGRNAESNLQLLCEPCHKAKSRSDVAAKSVSYRKRLKHLGLKPKGRPFPGSKESGLRKRMNGQVEKRT